MIERRSLIRFGFSAVVLLTGVSPTVAGDSQAIIGSIYQSLTAVVSADNRLSILKEAIPIDVWGSLSDPGKDRELAQMLGRLSQEPNWLGQTKLDGFKDEYDIFLHQAEWGRLPFNDNEQSEYNAILKQLFKGGLPEQGPSQTYARLLALKKTYNSTLSEWQSTASDQRSKDLSDRLAAARKSLDAFGKGQPDEFAVRTADKRLRTLLGYDYASFGRRAQDRFNRTLGDKGDPVSTLIPSLSSLANSEGWIKVDVDLSTTSEVSFGYRPDLKSILCCDEEGNGLDLAVTHINFEYALAELDRPWFDDDAIFGQGRTLWRLPPGLRDLSVGAPASKSTLASDLTFVPHRVVFVRELQVKFQHNVSLYNIVAAALRHKVQLRLGPFAVAGQFVGTLGSVDVAPYLDGVDSLIVPQAQVFATIGSINPKTPDPRQDLIWNSALPDLHIE